MNGRVSDGVATGGATTDPRRYDAFFLDFDGVVLESVDVKTEAFRQMYADHGPEVVGAVIAHHRAHGGVSRRQKIRHYHASLLGIDLEPSELDRLAGRFSELVEDAVVAAPWVAGAQAFLERHHDRVPLFVASGTPQDELRRIVARRGIGRYFREVRGTPPEKARLVADLLDRHDLDPTRVLFVGDSRTDHAAATAHGLPFVGHVPPATASPFPPGTTTIPDLTVLTV